MPAGGQGERFGGETPKQMIEVSGKPLLAWTIERLLAAGVEGLTVALPEDWLPSASAILGADERICWVAGGRSRQRSVAACLAASPERVDLVLVHDGARPAVAIDDVLATIAAVGEDDGAVLGRPMVDTLKQVEDGRILGTVDRRTLFRAETPQVFRRQILARALEQGEQDGFDGTDEAAMVERLAGARINVAMAGRPNPKLTLPQDLPWVRMLLQEGQSVS